MALGGVAAVAGLTLLLSASAPADPSTTVLAPDGVSAGAAHTCAIRADGTIACWGDDSAGQLDEIPSGEFRAISAGGTHTCAIRSGGTLACWGDDSAGRLDDVPGGEFRAVSAGGSHSCAIRAGGTLTCWGDDSAGQLDDVPSGEYRTVSAGGAHTCAIRSDSELLCWGDDSAGQVSAVPGGEPTVLPYRLHKHHNDRHHHHYKDDPPAYEAVNFIAVGAGDEHTCAVETGGTLDCWGGNSAGQLDGMPEGSFLAVSTGAGHSCAIRASGALACWGDDSAGQLDEVPAGSFLFVSAGGSQTCAVSTGGALVCWPEPELEAKPELGPATASSVPQVGVDESLPPPIAGVNFNLEPVTGVSRVRCSGDKGFSVLTEPKQVPIDCQVDAHRGVVKVTTATGEREGTQSSYFWGGRFNVSQEAKTNWETNLHLAGRLKCEKRSGGDKGGARTSRRKFKRGQRAGRKLWGSGKGRYKTRGNYGSATVRGTVWLVRDRCDNSTLFKVRRGVVAVEDFVKEITVTIPAGKQYVARSAIPRLR